MQAQADDSVQVYCAFLPRFLLIGTFKRASITFDGRLMGFGLAIDRGRLTQEMGLPHYFNISSLPYSCVSNFTTKSGVCYSLMEHKKVAVG